MLIYTITIIIRLIVIDELNYANLDLKVSYGRGNVADKSPVVIEDNVWIGEYSVILKGVKIGEGPIVATRAVVTKDVPPYTIVAGNPAKVVKYLK